MQDLFADALDLPEAQRDEFLARIHDETTRAELASLLASYDLAEKEFGVSPMELLIARAAKPSAVEPSRPHPGVSVETHPQRGES